MAEVGKITYLRRGGERDAEIAPKRPIVLRSAAMFRKGAAISAIRPRRPFQRDARNIQGRISSDEDSDRIAMLDKRGATAIVDVKRK